MQMDKLDGRGGGGGWSTGFFFFKFIVVQL